MIQDDYFENILMFLKKMERCAREWHINGTEVHKLRTPTTQGWLGLRSMSPCAENICQEALSTYCDAFQYRKSVENHISLISKAITI